MNRRSFLLTLPMLPFVQKLLPTRKLPARIPDSVFGQFGFRRGSEYWDGTVILESTAKGFKDYQPPPGFWTWDGNEDYRAIQL